MMKTIKVAGLKNSLKLEEYITSSLVDVIYFEEAIGDTVILSVENDAYLDNAEDRKWIAGLINKGLLKCQESSAKIILE